MIRHAFCCCCSLHDAGKQTNFTVSSWKVLPAAQPAAATLPGQAAMHVADLGLHVTHYLQA